MKLLFFCGVAATIICGSAAFRRSISSLRRAKLERAGHFAVGSDVQEVRKAHPEMPIPKAIPYPYNIFPERCPTGQLHVGCVYDTQKDQRRWYDDKIPKEDRHPMTPDLCFAFCKKVSGAQYFGLTRGDQCYCTPFFHNTGMNAHGDCDLPCTGNHSRTCGGMERSDVYVLHDCKNLPELPCKKPPQPPMHAKLFQSSYYRVGTPCANTQNQGLTTLQSMCDVECEEGFFLAKNDISCKRKGDPLGYSWAQVQGQALCQPVSCGSPPAIPHSTSPLAPVLYGVTVSYACQLGYSLDTNPKGLKDFTLICQGDGNFNHTEDVGCFKVSCGKCPSGDKYNNSKVTEKGTRYYTDKCQFKCDSGYTLDSEPAGNKNFALTCLPSGEFSEPRTCLPVDCGAPPPVQHARAITKEAVVFPGIARYEVNEGFTMTGKPQVGQTFTRQCQADGLFTDIIPPAELKLAPRYEPEYEMSRMRKEKPEPPKPVIEPVPCGRPPAVDNALYDDKVYVFGQTVVYECHQGYTVTGTSDGETSPELICSVEGKYTWKSEISPMPRCLPVECGTVPQRPFAKLITELESDVVTAASPALVYECNPGYSTDMNDNPYNPQGKFATISCKASGEFTPAEDCVNIQDCGTFHCGPHGDCVDVDPPTAKPFDNYDCNCAAGYELTVSKGSRQRGDETKECTNINDCPAPAEESCGGLNSIGMRRGLCNDLVQAYKCQCSMGYKVSVEGSNETCVPVECGVAPKVEHAQNPMEGQKANYDTPPWKYSCDEGYSVSGKHGGSKELQCRCSASGQFSTLQLCLPVSCGSPHSVDHTTMSPRVEELKYPTKLTYTADAGYSLTGKKDGAKSFEVECQADSKQTELKKVLPVECGTVPTQKFATYDDKRVFVFKDTVAVKCDKGFSTDETPHPNSLQYDITCEAAGEFSNAFQCKPITIPLKDVPIDCGKPPKVAHATVAGSQLFGGQLTYTAVEGYSLDGSSAKEQKQFEIKCLPTEEYTPVRKFQRIKCGPSVDVEFTKAVEFIAAAKAASFLRTAASVNVGSVKETDTHKTYPTSFGDMVKYTCMDGYKIPRGRRIIVARDPRVLTLRCDATGELLPVSPAGPSSLNCVPVNCVVPKGEKKDRFAADLEAFGGRKIEFGNKQPFKCLAGYTLDGTPGGETEYIEACQANGKLTNKNRCQNIDWCLVSQCGGKGFGRCIDNLLDYSCICRPGFEVVSPDGFHKQCVEIDECKTQQGDKLCAGDGNHGTCEDQISKYECKCKTGYENTRTITGQDSCTAILCPSVIPRAFSTSAQVGGKVQYTQTVVYMCKPGYTVDGKKDGPIEYSAICLNTGKMSEVADCKPVSCECEGGTCVPSVEHSTTNGSFDSALVYGQAAKFTCDKGYTTTGDPAAPNTFIVSCSAGARLTTPGACLPVECGLAPRIPNSIADESKVLVFTDTATMKCRKGYTLTGRAEAATSFTFECLADGTLKGSGSCIPISCGAPKKIRFAQHSVAELVYTQQVDVYCQSGYSVDSDPNGESTFVGTCTADGSIAGMKDCKPVTCGRPKAETGATSKDSETFFGRHATWNCLPGFSTDGTPMGGTSLSRQCLDHGSFGKSSPSNCVDIDFCTGNPCTSNGVCKDLGEGAVKPGYSCDCSDGYERKIKPDGSETCSQDDCAGSPCGVGGTCTDLSKMANIDGAYTCECELGYELDESKKNAPTCIRTQCGKMPTQILHVLQDGHLPKVTLETWNKKPSDRDEGIPILKAGDSVTYTCAEGYSTDGKFSEESLPFTVRCEASGMLSREISSTKMCTLIVCDNGQKPMVAFATVTSPKEEFYEYGDKILFECNAGYTTTGEVRGSKSLEVQCRKDGTFSEVLGRGRGRSRGRVPGRGRGRGRRQQSCFPIECSIPRIAHAKPSSGFKSVKFSTVVTYSCVSGYVAVGRAAAQFSGVCGAKGKIDFAGANGCVPLQCGTPATQPNADLFLPARGRRNVHLVPFPDGRIMTSADSPVIAKCRSGYTIGGAAGGVDVYSLECKQNGKFAAMVGNEAMVSKCDAPKFQVSGVVTDAQSARIFLSNAWLDFSMDGSTKVTAKSDRNGKYNTALIAGTYRLMVKRTGYITYESEIVIATSIAVGGAGDVALSKILPEGEWRVTLNWAKHSRDLDSHTYFGQDAKTLVFYARKSIYDSGSGVTVTLDRDDVNGYGPETTTFKGVGKCRRKSNCLVKFMVDNYTPRDGDLGASDGIVTVYKGSRVAKKYTIPVLAGKARIWPIFTLDASKDATEVLFDGDQTYGPTLLPSNELDRQNWGASFDSQQWSKFEDNKFHLLAGLKVQSFAGLNNIQEASWAAVDHTKKFDCQEVDWFEASATWSKESGWSSCGAGYYLAGFYRTGHKWDRVHDPQQITKAYCCKPEELPKEWGACHEDPLFSQPGWSGCKESRAGRQTVMVGLQMKDGSNVPQQEPLKRIREAKCCELVGGGMMPTPEPEDDGGDGDSDGAWW